MVRITNKPGENNGFRHIPKFLSGIYITVSMEAQCLIVPTDWIKHDKVTHNAVQFNAVNMNPAPSSERHPLRRYFPYQKTSGVIPRPHMNPLTTSPKVSSHYLLTT